MKYISIKYGVERSRVHYYQITTLWSTMLCASARNIPFEWTEKYGSCALWMNINAIISTIIIISHGNSAIEHAETRLGFFGQIDSWGCRSQLNRLECYFTFDPKTSVFARDVRELYTNILMAWMADNQTIWWLPPTKHCFIHIYNNNDNNDIYLSN